MLTSIHANYSFFCISPEVESIDAKRQTHMGVVGSIWCHGCSGNTQINATVNQIVCQSSMESAICSKVIQTVSGNFHHFYGAVEVFRQRFKYFRRNAGSQAVG